MSARRSVRIRRPAWVRAESVVAAALALLLAGLAPALVSPRPAALFGRADSGCTPGFPVRMTPAGDGMHASAIGRFVVCQSASGTSILVRNATAAVWVLVAPRDVTLHRNRASHVDGAFLDLVRTSPSPVLLPGSAIALHAPASRLAARVDAGLTIAALAHERLATSLLAAAPAGSRGGVLAGNRDMLASCVGAVLERLPVPGAVLSSEDPGRRISGAIAEVADSPGSACVRGWAAAVTEVAVPGHAVAPLSEDVARWAPDPSFGLRALDAAITYSAIHAGLDLLARPDAD